MRYVLHNVNIFLHLYISISYLTTIIINIMKNQITTLKLIATFTLSSGLLFSCLKSELVKEPDLSLKSIKIGEKSASVNLSQSDLIWSDEFNTVGSFDTTKWSYAER